MEKNPPSPRNPVADLPTPAWDRRTRRDCPPKAPPAKPDGKSRLLSALVFASVLAGCASSGVNIGSHPRVAGIQLHTHRDSDDLLTGGLGATGLRSAVAPAFANAEQPTAAERRRRAIWSNWRGIADLAPGGGYGEFYGSLEPVPGREYHALMRVPGANQPHRVMVQLPDSYDASKRCVVVAASSGSRGIYGAIALAGGWGLPRGCAVAYTDKGAGTGYVDTGTGLGVRLDGEPTGEGDTAEFSTSKHAGEGIAPIAIKHAHSGDNPEADWGRHVRQAADFALEVLQLADPGGAPYTHANTRVIAVGVSNGGGAVLRAAELTQQWLDGVVAISPNILPGEGGRALYDYSTDAALWMPCALNAATFDAVVLARPGGAKSPAGTLRCASLQTLGLIDGATPDAQATQALAHLHAQGWTDAALAAGAISSSFDLWRAVAVTYASAYARTGADNMPCGFAFHALDASGKPRAPTIAERAAWASDASGIPPGAGVSLVDTLAAGADPALPGLRCLRELWQGQGTLADAARSGIEATRTKLPRAGLPVLVVHGADDGLVPEAFSGAAYARWAKAQGRDVRYWRVGNAQHFDGFLGLPFLGARYVPMMPYAYRALDRMWAHVAEGKSLPGDADIATTPRAFEAGKLAPLQAVNLGAMPE